MYKAIIITAVAVSLSGCASVGDAMSYSPTVHKLQMANDTYRIFEHPKRDRIMVTPSLATGVGGGLVEGVTLGGADAPVSAAKLQPVARKWLNDTGRSNCIVNSSREVVKWQYEYTFSCAGETTTASPAP